MSYSQGKYKSFKYSWSHSYKNSNDMYSHLCEEAAIEVNLLDKESRGFPEATAIINHIKGLL